MLAKNQNDLVFCALCGAAKDGNDWDISNVIDPCDPHCHIAEDALDDPELAAIDKEMSYIDEIINRINRLGSLIAAIDSMPVVLKPRFDGHNDGEDDSQNYIRGLGYGDR